MDITALNSILELLLDNDPSLKTVIIVSVDGLPLVSKTNVEADEEKISAVASLAMSSLEKVAGELALGDFENAIIRTKDGVVFIYDLGKEGTLVAVADKSVKLGLALYELKKAAADAEQVLKSAGSSAIAGETA